MVMVARGASRNVRIVRMYPLTVLFTFTMVIIINSILGLIMATKGKRPRAVPIKYKDNAVSASPNVTVYMKSDHFTHLINLQNGGSNPEKKKF